MIKLRNGAFFATGTTAFSYSTCIVAWDEVTRTMFFNDRRYSPTTTKHQDMAWEAFSYDQRAYAILGDDDVPAPQNLAGARLSPDDLIALGRKLIEANPRARITSDEETAQ